MGQFIVESELFHKVREEGNGCFSFPGLFTKTEACDELHDRRRSQLGLR